MKRAVLLLVTVALVAITSTPATAYLKLGTQVGSRTVSLKWSRLPIRYYITNQDIANVTAAQLQQTVGRAFNTWGTVSTAQLSSQFAGFTGAAPSGGDGLTALGFQNRPDLDRVLGATTFMIDTVSGEIVESDIFFNAAFPWSVASAGETGRYDLESIALHEIGHLHGLGHSAMGETELRSGGRRVIAAEAVMFPIAFSAGSIDSRTLKADDIAGISEIYPSSTFARQTGSISGKVTKNGKGIPGAHVVAFNPRTGKMVGGFTLSADGTFVIAGLEPGPHVIRVEPLDDADIESFFDPSLNVDVDFKVTFYDKLVVVPRGGGAGNVAITVVAK